MGRSGKRAEPREVEELGYGYILVRSSLFDPEHTNPVEKWPIWQPQQMGHVAVEVSSSEEVNWMPCCRLLAVIYKVRSI